MIKNVKKKGRVWHLPDSLEQREPSEKMKYKELSANTVAFISVDEYFQEAIPLILSETAYDGRNGLCTPYFVNW